jgi:hypothetical protein
MIKRIFLTFFILVVIYSGFIFFISKKKKDYFLPQYMWQENMIRMQKYVYLKKNFKNVVLGSSLTGRLEFNENTTPDYYSLAAGGGDPFIGLEIIKKTDGKPKRIFIESNFLLTKAVHDKTYLSSLYLPVFFDLRKTIPFLREQNQPINYAGKVGISIVYKLLKVDSSTNKSAGISKANKDELLRNRQFHNDYDPHDFEKDKKTIEGNLVTLKNYIDYYKKIGISICFFEMPRDCEVENMLTIYSREKVTQFAKSNNIDEIPLPPCADYTTVDGLHLSDNSAMMYLKYFSNQIKLKNLN